MCLVHMELQTYDLYVVWATLSELDQRRRVQFYTPLDES